MTFINVRPAPATPLLQLAAHPLLRELAPEVLQSLCARAELRPYRDGSVVFHEGDAAQHWLLVARGHVEVVRFGSDGSERVYHRFGPGECVAEAAMFMAHGRYPMQARAVGVTTVWRLERQALRQACEHHPALALRLLEDFSRRLYHYINEVEWLTVSSAPQRLAAFLLRLQAQQGPQMELPSSQRQVAAHLGVRAETLSRLLSEWQARQWLRGERRHWTLLDTAPLQQLAGALARSF
ncbi:Crp/Fnr family transcriptional regulator [Simplicispira lacusdiani]|uniref:Crp/Fnr family transcriptional regulator n=1 Tax=Simplicispira lacusdiani TaxID=2213010 RepID=UPI000E770B6D|nr:Crp/Fnr family transcriptional regulator [Simplicispira lacusdiani]